MPPISDQHEEMIFLHMSLVAMQESLAYIDIIRTLMEEEEEEEKVLLKRKRGSVPGRKTNKLRNRQAAHERIYRMYFSDEANQDTFRRKFRMRSSLFLQLMEDMQQQDDYFQQKSNAAGALGFSPMMKVTIALRQLSYGVPAKCLDEAFDIGDSTSLECLLRFCRAVINKYSTRFLRRPTQEDTHRIMAFNKGRGFPGMLGSIDCMHWEWKNRAMPLILEAVATHDLWIWHPFFGYPVSMNDLSVPGPSSISTDHTAETAVDSSFKLIDRHYDAGYYLADEVYPSYKTFVKSIPTPNGQDEGAFVEAHEATRKDVERAFSVLRDRFAIVKTPNRLWKKGSLCSIIKACIILHNMIVEDEDTLDLPCEGGYYDGSSEEPITNTCQTIDDLTFISSHKRQVDINDGEVHEQLQKDLVSHISNLKKRN